MPADAGDRFGDGHLGEVVVVSETVIVQCSHCAGNLERGGGRCRRILIEHGRVLGVEYTVHGFEVGIQRTARVVRDVVALHERIVCDVGKVARHMELGEAIAPPKGKFVN